MSSATENKTSPSRREKPAIQLTKLGASTGISNPMQWPAASFLQEHLGGEGAWWQACARLALLRKFGFWKDAKTNEEKEPINPKRIQTAWEDVVLQSSRERQQQQPQAHNDLTELIAHGKSNNRPLQWAIMTCPPACQFHLHAHPNLELVYCLKGELHEVRMNSSPIETSAYEPIGDDNSKLQVRPSISVQGWRQKEWKFGTVSAGNWLVNEVGSIHKSVSYTHLTLPTKA